MIGTSVCTRSGVSRPPGSLRQRRLTFERRRLARALGEIFIGVFGRNGVDDVEHRIDADIAGDFAFSTSQPSSSFHSSEMRASRMPLAAIRSMNSRYMERGVISKALKRPAFKRSGVFLIRWLHQLDPRPGIFFELAHAFFQMRAGDQFDGVEAGAVHRFGDRQHHAGGHALRPQALMAVADGGVDESNTVMLS